MDRYSLTHLTPAALISGLKAHAGRERGSLADVLAHIAEVEAQELYKPAGYSSMHMFCVHELHFSKDEAKKRIRAARKARAFPVVFERVEQGALQLTSLLILASTLTTENVEELLAASAFRSDFEVREILAERFPQTPVPTTIEPIAEPMTLEPTAESTTEARMESVSEHAEGAAQPLQGTVKPLHVKPIGAGFYKATLTMSRAMHEKLRHAKDLLGYRQSMPDEAEILEAGLDLFIAQIQKKKFGATDRPRAARGSKSPGYVSNAVKREVFERDGGRCTFESEDGTHCPEKKGVEWDHILPVARGGGSEPSNVRLRCRAHNQLEAERTFGKPFMEHKREQAKAAAAARREQSRVAAATKRRLAEEAERSAQAARDHEEFIWWMCKLGVSEADAELAGAKFPPHPGQRPETRRLLCLQFVRERDRLAATGT